jgi:(1->4)-alpha-D-glucan 1-alpha-D-glucosylmutase
MVASRLSRPPGGFDIARSDVARALVELAAQLNVYRTYVDASGSTGDDRRRLQQAAAGARGHLDEDCRRALDALLPLLLGGGLARSSDAPDPAEPDAAELELQQRWQQHTGAVTAKGVEDTALYRFGGLLALAEVGTDPGRPPVTVDQFHQAMGERRRRGRGSLNTTSTHDTKRSEDVRSRLAALSELPQAWDEYVTRWHGWHRSLPSTPDPQDELFAYQTIVGAWPLDADDRSGFSRRVQDYMIKALREAKVRTSWLQPDEDYERIVRSFVRTVLAPSNHRFHADLGRLLQTVGPAGAVNALAMTVLKCTAPGVPDVYQGTELWSHALVDPDNRRPVDFDRRARLAHALDQATDGEALAARLLAAWPDGRLKLMVTQRLLRLRRGLPQLFDHGSYVPLDVHGRFRSHVVAFARHRRSDWTVVVVPRLPLGVAGAGRMPVGPDVWQATSVILPDDSPSQLIDVLTGSEVSRRGGALVVGDLFSTLPCSVLVAR